MVDIGTLLPLVFKIILLSFVCFVSVHSLFMMYHWYAFGQNTRAATLASAIYLGGLFITMSLMAVSALTY